MLDTIYILLAGILVVISTSLLGSFLLLRRMVMVGDAISHAVLPGIVLAFLWSGTRDPWWMLIGAACLGFLVTYLVQLLTTRVKLQSDAAIGVSFTSLFALGIVLITVYASKVDLDQACVLYGEIAYVPIDPWITSNNQSLGPRSLYIMGTATIVILLFVYLFYKQLSIISFDPQHAASLGLSVSRWHYALMNAVSFVVVSAFEVVGAILVIAFLVVPPATAYLLTKRLPQLLVLSCVLGIIAVIGGYHVAAVVDGSIAGAMATFSGLIFALCFLFKRIFGKVSTRSST